MKHSSQSDEGLGLSLLVYAAVMLGALLIIAAPIYWLNGPAVYANPGAQADTANLSPAIYGPQRERKEFPLAFLKRPDIVSSDMLAALSAKTKKVAERERPRTVSRPVHSAYAQAPTDEEQRPQRRGFLFGLF